MIEIKDLETEEFQRYAAESRRMAKLARVGITKRARQSDVRKLQQSPGEVTRATITLKDALRDAAVSKRQMAMRLRRSTAKGGAR